MKDELKQIAWKEFFDSAMIDSDGSDNYRLIEWAFGRGFDAGYAANKWVKVEDGLPVSGRYFVMLQDIVDGELLGTVSILRDGQWSHEREQSRYRVVAYMPIPPFEQE